MALRRVTRGLAAMAGLAAALVGVPVGLEALGQGPPSGVPTGHSVAGALTRDITDSTLLRSAALLCWLLWALFAVAVVLEIAWQIADADRRMPDGPRRHRFGVPGMQSWVRTLVLSAALLLPQRALPSAMANPRPEGAAPVAAVVKPAGRATTGSSALVSGAPTARSSSEPHRYVVQRYDSLWAIAERQLGDGTLWRQIRDEQGRSLDNGAAGRTIHPGEVLLLPWAHHGAVLHLHSAPRRDAPAHVTSRSPVGPRPAADGSPESGPTTRRSPSTPISTATASPPAPALTPSGRTEPSAYAAPAPAATVPPPQPAEVPPGPAPAATVPPPQPAEVPPGPAPAATVPPPQPAEVPPGPPVALSPAPAPSSTLPPPTMVAVAADHGSLQGGSTTTAVIEAGLAGAAALSTIQLLRRRQARLRPLGRRIRLPRSGAVHTELALLRGVATDRVLLVGRAVASIVQQLRRQGATPPAIVGVLVDDDAVEVLLSNPAPAPAPWSTVSEGFRWRLDASELPADQPDESPPFPALAAIGRVVSGSADALINLEAAGLVGISGDRFHAAAFVHTVAAQLIGSPWAQAASLILVGFPPGLRDLDNVRAVATLGEISDELRTTAEVMSATARQNGCADVVVGRLRGCAGDGWPPVIVLAAQKPKPDEVAMLAGVAAPGTGVAAVVVDAGAAAAWEIDASARPCPVNPLRLAVEPTVLDDETAAAINELIAAAGDNDGASLDEPPYDRVELSVERPSQVETGTTAAAPRLPDFGSPPILVRVLGSVEVDGAAEFKRAKSRELVVYLAMHPNGVGEAELDEALWASNGARLVASSTRDATVSVARTAVGGAARLLPAQGQGREKRYQLGPEVQSDWSQFCALHRFGRQHESTVALRHALGLIRGRPFEAVISGRTYGWIHTEGHGRHIEAEVADAADLASRLFLEAGDPLSARWAARRGLLAEPYTERLWVRLMEAADGLGESQEIERIMDEMDVVLGLEGDFSGLHPNTLAAYDRFTRRHRHPADR